MKKMTVNLDVNERDYDVIKASEFFDEDWYLSEYQDVASMGCDPLIHYVKFAIPLKRNPSRNFDTSHYLMSNPDVAESGINPLLHFILHGHQEGRTPLPVTISPEELREHVDIVIPVFNALQDVKKCLSSIKVKQDGFYVRAIIVNDGSDEVTTSWLGDFCNGDDTFLLVEHKKNKGYTKAINTGLKLSNAPYVVALNSDTIVTAGWLKGLVRCINSDQKIGIVGPLSNAASWQNTPKLYGSDGHFAVNELPAGVTPDNMAQFVAASSNRLFPRLPFVNGFCFMIKRAVINSIGFMDEENFPVGYGEENDYSIRARDAGFELAIADDTYVYHAKSKSFGHDRRKQLSEQGSETLKRKHSAEKYNLLVRQVKDTAVFDKIRLAIQKEIHAADSNANCIDIFTIKILFLLPVKGGGGGAHSVVQEVEEMRRLGIIANIAVRQKDLASFLDIYQDIDLAADIFIAFTERSLISISESYDVVVGTIYHSMELVTQITKVFPHILPAYYVQDYEPLFFPPESNDWHVARRSYTLGVNAILFAKTHWIIRKVQQEHEIDVHKVSPSIDHKIYVPSLKSKDCKIHIAAMIRPQTPRRGAKRTMQVLSRLMREFHGDMVCHLFGCSESDPQFQELQHDFDYMNEGVLTRPDVAALLKCSDIFIDLSDYQAFGRTALEAMACGCVAMVPKHGGADEYAIDDVNALVVDSFREEECVERLRSLILNKKKLSYMQRMGLLSASNFSVHRAAISILNVFGQELPKHRKCHPIKNKPCLALVPSRRKGGLPTGSGYVRVICPYGSADIRQQWKVSVYSNGKLPIAGAADVVLIQRDAGPIQLDQLKVWLSAWRSRGGKIIYEIDDDLLDAEGLLQRGFAGDIKSLTAKVGWLAAEADAVFVSTPHLQKKIQKFNQNVCLTPNFLDPNLWKVGEERLNGSHYSKKRDRDVIRIGYIGTPTHDKDLSVVAQAMQQIEKTFGSRVEIEVIGAFQDREPMFGKRVGLPKKNDYPNFVDWLHRRVDWDIGIIPLAVDEFNKSKSYLKFLEYAALNMAVVCSNIEPYRSVVEHQKNGLLVDSDTGAWVQTISSLIENEALRKKLAESAFVTVSESHLLANGSSLLLDFLGEIPSMRGSQKAYFKNSG